MSLDHCAALVAEGDPDRFLSAMTAPVGGRARLLPLYATVLEIARAPWASAEPMIGLMRLQFWDDALADLCAGRAVRAHPVLEALASVIEETALPAAEFAALVAARRRDVDPEPYSDGAEFHAYVMATAAGPMRLASRALGAETPEAAEGIGFASGVAGILRALPELAGRGRMPLPGLSGRDRAELAEGRTTEALGAAVAAIGAEARARHAQGLEAARRADPAARPALRAGWRAGYLLARARPGLDVLRDLGPESEFRRRWGLVWRSTLGRV